MAREARDIINGIVFTIHKLAFGPYDVATLVSEETPMPAKVVLNPQSFTLDAGARQRVSQLNTLGDYKILDADETLLVETVGTGTGAFTNNTYTMTVDSGE